MAFTTSEVDGLLSGTVGQKADCNEWGDEQTRCLPTTGNTNPQENQESRICNATPISAQ